MAETTTDHDTIRAWAERHGGKPAAVDRTHQGGDVGIIRIMFPNAQQSEHKSLVEISWDEFFREFEDRQLALLFDPDGLFSKIVGRDTVARREHGEHHADRQQASTQSGHRSEGHARGDEARHVATGGSQAREESGRRGGGSEQESLKEREYRDKDGNIHHHTRTYQEQHGRK